MSGLLGNLHRVLRIRTKVMVEGRSPDPQSIACYSGTVSPIGLLISSYKSCIYILLPADFQLFFLISSLASRNKSMIMRAV